MLRRIHDMPAHTIGFEVVGEADDDDFEDVVEPVLREEIAAGRKLRLLYVVGPQADADGDLVKSEAGFSARHATSFERLAVVSDEDWLRPLLRVMSLLMPGKSRGFRVRELAEAKAWLAEGAGTP